MSYNYGYFDENGNACEEEQAVRRVYSPMGYTVNDVRGKVGDDWVLWHKLCEGRVGDIMNAECRLHWAMYKGPEGDMYRSVLNAKIFLMEERVFQGKIYGVKLSGYGPEKTWQELLALAEEKLGERPDHIHILDSFGEWKSHVDTVHAEPNWDERVVYFERGVGWSDDDLSFDQPVGSASEICIDLWHERG